jgi:hypothetical protein
MNFEPIREKKLVFCLLLSGVLLLPNFLNVHLQALPGSGHSWEIYNPQIAKKLRSVAQMEAALDAEANARKLSVRDTAYGNTAARIVSERFFHGYSHYALNENWIASLAGKLVWDHLSAIVLPDDVLQYSMAACSQQSIVLMELFRRKGINYRRVGFEHHYLLEGKFAGNWYLFDPDMEPDFSVVAHNSYDSLRQQGALIKIYHNQLDAAGISWAMANSSYGKENAAPAPYAAIFHQVTKVLSRTLWLLPLLFLFLVWIRQRQKVIGPVSTNKKGRGLQQVFYPQKEY